MDAELPGPKPALRIVVKKRKKGRPLPCERLCESCVKPCETPANPDAWKRNRLVRYVPHK